MTVMMPPPLAPVTPLEAPRPERRRARWINWLVLAAAVGATAMLDPGAPVVVVLVFVLVVPFEKLFPRHHQRIRRPEVGTDIGYAALQPGLSIIGIAVAVVFGVVSLAWLPGLLIRPLVVAIPVAVQPVVAFLLFDFTIYWVHRWSHEVSFLWRFHAVHHSTRKLDWVSGFRAHPADGALLAPAFIFLIAAGFDPEVAGALVIVQIVTGLFLHANVRWRWRPLHRIVITPEFHHWHHANEPHAINTNYSVFLPAWDLLFGTYRMPRDARPQVYGIAEYMPSGIVAQLKHPVRGLPGPRWVLRHPLLATKRTWRALPGGLAQVRTSTLRPTRARTF
jgi:sterol desaturase/sphingolipid hydroxylase (fatty acid hydroxylase superfamily)